VNLVDSSAWLAYFAGEPNAARFAGAIEDDELLVVSAISVLEVFKVSRRERGEDEALQAIAAMRRGTVVALDFDLAVEAADLGLRHKLPLADSVIFATAVRHQATLWTQDEHFAALPQVRYFPKNL
jgi:predicted nucleic acid-binding protein